MKKFMWNCLDFSGGENIYFFGHPRDASNIFYKTIEAHKKSIPDFIRPMRFLFEEFSNLRCCYKEYDYDKIKEKIDKADWYNEEELYTIDIRFMILAKDKLLSLKSLPLEDKEMIQL